MNKAPHHQKTLRIFTRSKINATQLVGLIVTFTAVFGLDFTPEQQVAIATVLTAIQSIVTVIYRTWFNKPIS